jgi:ferredoxin-NADP reductase
MVAGGVGIAPLLGMLEHAAIAGDQRRFCLIYAGRHPAAFAAIDRIEALSKILDLEAHLVADQTSGVAGFLPGPLDAAFVTSAMRDPSRAVAYVCGPPAMMAMATDTLISGGMSPERVHYERFDDMARGGRLDRRRLRQDICVLALAFAAVLAFALR